MVDRTDHFSRIRGEDAPSPEPPEGAPMVSQDLVDWLEREGFGQVTLNAGGFPGCRDHEVQVVHGVTYAGGQLSVIQYLRTLVKVA
jgi:hypothetical protein